MTPKRALEIIKDELFFESGIINEAIQILEKQLEFRTPEKPILSNRQEIRYAMCYDCPNCGKSFTGTGFADYCYHCGQALDWSDNGV